MSTMKHSCSLTVTASRTLISTPSLHSIGITVAMRLLRRCYVAMLGITNHSKVPLRLAAMLGFATSLLSLLVALCYFVYTLIIWSTFSVGIASLAIGLSFFSSVQLFFLGGIGEYIGSIHTQVLKRPLVEKEG